MNVLSPGVQQSVEQKLVSDGLITAENLAKLKDMAAKNSQPLFSLLIEKGHVSDEQLTKALAVANSLPYVNLSQAHIDAKILTLLPKDTADQYMAVPLGEMQNRLVVAMLDADNVQAVDFLSNKIGRPLKVYAASETGIKHILSQYGRTGLEQGVASMFSSKLDTTAATAKAAQEDIQSITLDSPISKALSSVMEYAAKNGASDVHIEPLENEIKVRCRIDGVLREIMKLPKTAEAPLISRIKILSNLKIDEHRVPQDGQFTIKVDNNPIDLRIAVSPTVWGEQVVLRLLDKTGTSLKLEDMGYRGRALRLINKGLERPHGMILTSGPTGSGKSTSMYAMIQQIK